MREIPFVVDPVDATGNRCESSSGSMQCHRRRNHPPLTQVALPKDNPEDPDVVVSFNHRGLAAGRYFTW